MSTAGERMPERAPETVVAQLRPHGRRLVLPAVVLVAVSAAGGYLSGTLAEDWQRLALLGGVVLVVLLAVVVPFLAWLGTRYTVTSRRIVVRGGGLRRVRQELLHSRGYDVTLVQSPVQTIVGSGTIEINTGLEHPVVLRDVPSARVVQEALNDLMETSVNPAQARRQRSQAQAPDETVHWGSR